jgi:hypothetical protein
MCLKVTKQEIETIQASINANGKVTFEELELCRNSFGTKSARENWNATGENKPNYTSF